MTEEVHLSTRFESLRCGLSGQNEDPADLVSLKEQLGTNEREVTWVLALVWIFRGREFTYVLVCNLTLLISQFYFAQTNLVV